MDRLLDVDPGGTVTSISPAVRDTVAALFGSLLPIAISVLAVRSGWVMGRNRLIDRDESSIRYWLTIALGLALGAYLHCRGVRRRVAL